MEGLYLFMSLIKKFKKDSNSTLLELFYDQVTVNNIYSIEQGTYEIIIF